MIHSSSLYTKDTVLIDNIPHPQYVHKVLPNSLAVDKGIKIVPEELINCTLEGEGTAEEFTKEIISELTQRCRAGLILATGGNIWTGYYPNLDRSDKYPTHKILPLGMTQIYAGKLANSIGYFDYISTDSTSCISGHSAWHRAKMMLDCGFLDMVVVVSVDNGISEEYMHLFAEHSISKKASEEDNPDITKFHLGQGCNISVFKSRNSDTVPTEMSIATISDISIQAEVHSSPLGMTSIGQGYRSVLKAVDTTGISFIKTHGTYTKENRVEEEIIRELCGDVPLVNYKLDIGHTMGPSTAIETDMAIKEHSGKFVSLGAGMGNVFSAVTVEIDK